MKARSFQPPPPYALRALAPARGVVAIEAAIVLPVLLLMMLAALETYSYLRAAALVSRGAFDLAQAVAQHPNWRDQGNCAQADDICALPAVIQDTTRPLDFGRGGALTVAVHAADPGPVSAPWPAGDPSSWLVPAEWQFGWSGTSPASLPTSANWPPATVGDTLVRVDVGFYYEPVLVSPALWSGIVGSNVLHRHAQVLAPATVRNIDD